MRQQDFSRLQRQSLRNSLESLISEGRNMEDKKEDVDAILGEIQLWLEEGPMHERDNMTLLSDKFTQVYKLVHPPPPPPPPSPSPSPVEEQPPAQPNATHTEL